jgi:hypothetical protein
MTPLPGVRYGLQAVQKSSKSYANQVRREPYMRAGAHKRNRC